MKLAAILIISLATLSCSSGNETNPEAPGENPASTETASTDETPEPVLQSTSAPTERLRPVPDTSIMSIAFERRGCGGACPAYSVRVNQKGEVRFKGDSGVKTAGEESATIDPAKAKELADKFLEVDFFGLKVDDIAGAQPGDDIAVLSMIKEDFARAIIYRRSDPTNPPALAELEKLVHETTGVQQWLQ